MSTRNAEANAVISMLSPYTPVLDMVFRYCANVASISSFVGATVTAEVSREP